MNFECALCDFETSLENEIMNHCDFHDQMELSPNHAHKPPPPTSQAELSLTRPRHSSSNITIHPPRTIQNSGQTLKYDRIPHSTTEYDPTSTLFSILPTTTINDRKHKLKNLRIIVDLELDLPTSPPTSMCHAGSPARICSSPNIKNYAKYHPNNS